MIAFSSMLLFPSVTPGAFSRLLGCPPKGGRLTPVRQTGPKPEADECRRTSPRPRQALRRECLREPIPPRKGRRQLRRRRPEQPQPLPSRHRVGRAGRASSVRLARRGGPAVASRSALLRRPLQKEPPPLRSRRRASSSSPLFLDPGDLLSDALP